MATLAIARKSGKITGYNIQWYDGKHRRSIYLGSVKYSKKTAERLKDVVETLLYNERNGISVPGKTTDMWLHSAHPHLQSKLAKAGLITIEAKKTCQEVWNQFLKYRTDLKASTIKLYHYAQERFFEKFSPTEPIENITTDQLFDWTVSLRAQQYTSASITVWHQKAGAMLRWAVEQGWLSKNPFKGIPRESGINRDNDRIISMDEYAKLLEACPNQEWRTILALTRIGGLRGTAELRPLRWPDIQWEEGRFLVRSPKTERYIRHRERKVPLFPELREELEQLHALPERKDNEFVIQCVQRKSWQPYHSFHKIANKAGLEKIARPFDNMRMSRSNEILRAYGETKENLWLGHSQKVMRDHYLCLTDEDFLEAAQWSVPEKNMLKPMR